MTAISVDRLCKSYRGSSDEGAGNFDSYYVRETEVEAVRDISFAIGRQETLGLVGESGCGKTTAARLVLRLERPTAGRVVLDERLAHGGRVLLPERRAPLDVCQQERDRPGPWLRHRLHP